MENRNPYASPRAKVADADNRQDYGEIRVFTAQGRLGRVRYIGYTAGLAILIAVIGFGLAVAAAAVDQVWVAIALAAVTYVAIIVVQFLLTIQRAHDFNTTGWLSLILFVPLGALVFWFIPGSPDENRFGKPPPPNTAGAIVLALILPFSFFSAGILAAIAIPAYQDYTLRAQISEGLNLAAAVKVAVAETYENTDAAPADRLGAGLSAAATDTSGKYVASINVADGTILVRYGGEANGMITGKVLALQPYVMPDQSIVWQCGEAAAPAGAVAMAADAVTANVASDIAPRLLPSACRP